MCTENFSDTVLLRPEVLAFALAMEKRLRDNDHKAGWHEASDQYLLHRLYEEVIELQWALAEPQEDNVIREAADVANFSMMLADNWSRRMEEHQARM